jgi:RHS repeat-associated protein
MVVAKAEGNALSYLHTDGLGSVVLETTKTGAVAADQRYYAYGRRLDTSGHISGEQDYTGQRLDATGLLYYNARYYDPQLGQFVSPDTLVPEPTSFLDYNRYLYARGNPLKYSDPTGHYSVEELQQHFGVNSFDELMALFEEGGAYAGLEGWYDVLRAAQDGDTITATNGPSQLSLTGMFMRTEQGKIWIDMGRQGGLIPEAIFAHFGGLVRNDEGNITDLGTYELRGQEYAWRAAIAGGRRQGDMTSCNNVDCVAATIDGVGMAGTGLQILSPACMEFQPACYSVGRAVSWGASGIGALYTVANISQGDATILDVTMTIGTTLVGGVAKDKRVNLGAGAAQLYWDLAISPLQR